MKERLESVEVKLKNEQKKVTDCEQRIQSTEASLFDAGHQLRVALKAANRSKELERTLDSVQKKFLLLGEVLFPITYVYRIMYILNLFLYI